MEMIYYFSTKCGLRSFALLTSLQIGGKEQKGLEWIAFLLYDNLQLGRAGFEPA